MAEVLLPLVEVQQLDKELLDKERQSEQHSQKKATRG